MRILALSSSRVGNGAYLEAALPVISEFSGNLKNVAFIPFAAVDRNYAGYASKVQEGLSSLQLNIETVTEKNGERIIREADLIMVGGGNTFKLLHDLYYYGLINPLKEQVQKGVPYIGWSAGSNLTGPTICTTNDMPIIQPASFTALQFLPFQINPHYYNYQPEGFNGETRDMRLTEFVQLQDDKKVLGIPEGTWLRLENGHLQFDGMAEGYLFSWENGLQKTPVSPGSNLTHLL